MRRTRVVVEYNPNQRDGQHQAQGDAPAQLLADGQKRDFMPKALALEAAAQKIIRQNGHQRTPKHLQHFTAPALRDFAGTGRLSARALQNQAARTWPEPAQEP